MDVLYSYFKFKQQIPHIMELTQSFSENVYCGIGCHSPQNQSLLEFKSKMKALGNNVCTWTICRI